MIDYKCSVVMSTFNGSKYITEQLDSLRMQSRPFDEVIILDDCSTDDSVSIIMEYILKYHLNSWSLIRNKKNIGWKSNFKLGFDLATGDLIFPCDQDDVWLNDKCEKMVDVMKELQDVDLLASNYSLFLSEKDNGSFSYIETEKRMINNGSVQKISLDPRWPYVLRPGCTFCFRKSFYDEIKQNWNVRFPHDAILWRFARIKGSIAIINLPLIEFRRHGDNATSVRIRTKKQRIQTIEDYMYFHIIALSYPLKEDERTIISNGIRFLEKRKKLYFSRSIMRLIELLFFYRNYYLTFRGFLGDVYYVFFAK